ncbi:hypothetical protein HOA93_04340 [bacterium]|nr:hypothetical protein [bacterium]
METYRKEIRKFEEQAKCKLSRMNKHQSVIDIEKELEDAICEFADLLKKF